MPIRISGMNSGLDTEALVSAMVMNYQAKVTKQQKAQTSLQYKMTALKDVNSDVYNLFSSLDKLRFSSAYSLKSTSVSDPTKAKVTASGNATNGTQTLKVNELAQSGYLTGGEIDGKGKITGSSKLSEITTGGGANAFQGGAVDISVGGKKTTINLTDDMTVNQFVNKLKDAGVNASFDENYGRFYISSKNSGVENDFSLVAYDEKGLASLQSLGLFTKDATTMAEYEKWSNYTPDEAKKLIDAEFAKVKVTSEGKAKIYADAYNSAKKTLDSYEKTLKEDGIENAEGARKHLEGLIEKRDTDKDFSKYKSTDEKGNITWDTEGIKADLGQEKLDEFNALQKDIKKFETAVKNLDDVEAKIKANKDFVILDTTTGEARAATSADTAVWDKIGEVVTKENNASLERITNTINDKISNSKEMLSNMSSMSDSAGAHRMVGKDSEIELNGVKYTNANNAYSINGINIEATNKTDGIITITTNTDTQGIYDKVKDFLSQYNDVINKINKLYNAESAKGYEPLSDEEREQMSEKDIEKWEKKIKDSILRRDDSLSGIITALTGNMSKVYQVNGSSFSLGNFGINTLGLFGAQKNEQYAYHIDGDADDSATSGNKDKLMAAINKDPESVISFFQQLTQGVYDALNSKMRSSTLSSAYTIYNDKEMASEYSNYTSTIKKWQDKVSTMEDSYFKKFAAMEKTLAKLNSNTNALSGYFGG